MGKYLILLLALIFSFSGCVSFDSASTTGKLAKDISEHESLYNQNTTICDYLRLLDQKSFSNEYCANYSSHLKKIIEGLSVINAYGIALEQICEDSKFDTDDKLDLMIKGGETLKWFKLDDNSEEGIKKISGTVAKLITNTVKRKQLRNVVKELNEPIQSLIHKILIPELANRKKLYDNLNLHLKNITENPVELKPDMRSVYSISRNKTDTLFAHYNDLDLLIAQKFQMFLLEDLSAIEKCEKSLNAFALAHQKLAEEADKIGTQKDGQVAKEILESIKEIYQGTDKF